jgi:hypothetical protein
MSAGKGSRRDLRGIGLVSGGLDGALAVLLLEDQGIEVHTVHFRTGFGHEDDPTKSGSQEIVDVADEYLAAVVLRPKHGYGSALNPCIDCRIFMLRKAEEIRQQRGAHFVFTGEVIGQDAMSQKRAALDTIEDEAGLAGRLLRPLSAHLLAPTTLEREGAIDRGRLGGMHGRSRGGQVALARRLGPEPRVRRGGCCLLADPGFARRLRDAIAHRDAASLTRDDLLLLRVGRHLRLAHDLKVVLGRDEAESTFLKERAGQRWTCQVASGRGSFGLVDGELAEDRFAEVAALAARYSRERAQARIEVRLRRGVDERIITTAPASLTERLVI